ncbi:ATP-binding protein [Aquabacterium sp.]|uniref:ATP-binding protein n=1 Tax=Aquabacterium sp. TaxID=1872578 RepID=UPI0025BFE0E9|nr:ATP-binding protein [Aquabacterium sp.]
MTKQGTGEAQATPLISGDELDELVVRRTFWFLVGLTSIILMPYVAIWTRLGAYQATLLCLAMLLVNAFCAWRVHRHREPGQARWHLHIVISGLYGIVGLVAFIQGGIYAPALRWIAVLPFMALVSGLTRMGALLCCAFVLEAWWMATHAAPDLPEMRRQLLPSADHQTLGSAIGALLLFALFGWITTRWRQDAYLALDAARERAHQGDLAKERFLATISHEIRTPLSGMVGVSSTLNKPDLAPPERQRLTALLEHSARDLLDTLNNVLDWTKMSQGPVQLAHEAFDLRALLQESANLFAPACEAKGVQLVCEIAAETPIQFLGDKRRLRQVLNNLLSNAVKFTSQGEVRVQIEQDALAPLPAHGHDRWIMLSIQDSGIGMAPDKLPKLFKPFEQLDTAIGEQFGGTGLGLSIVQGLLQAMQGSIDVQSTPGRGTRFTVRIPLSLSSQRVDEPIETTDAVPPPAQPALRVLVAEDNLLNQRILQEMLQHCQVQSTFVTNGLDALQALKNDVFDVLLLDQHMPGLDGLSTLAAIRDEEQRLHRPRLPTVLISGDTSLCDQAKALDADACLSKPFEFTALKDTLAQMRHGKVPEPA